MSDTTDDPMTAYLRNRLTEIDTEIADRQAWRVEAQRTLDVWLDGRSRVNRQRKARTAGNSTAPPPEPDGNSTADGMALLNTSRLPLAERVVAAMQRDADSVP